MAYYTRALREEVTERGVTSLYPVPADWEAGSGNFYQLSLRMCRIDTLEYLYRQPTDSHLTYRDYGLVPELPRILMLDVSLNELTTLNYEHLTPLFQLRVLNASLNRIHRFSGVEVLHHLHTLDLSHNRITNISVELSHCPSLVKLNLAVNQIEDITLAPRLGNLRVLDLHHNKMKSLSGIQSFPLIEELYVQSNHLMDIVALSSNLRLVALNASDNRIKSLFTTIEILKSLKRLDTVDLYNNPVADNGGYKSAIVESTRISKLDGVDIRWHHQQPTDRRAMPETSRLADRHPKTSVLETARLAYRNHLAEKRRHVDESNHHLRGELGILREDYDRYEALILRDLDVCLAFLMTVPSDDARTYTYEYFHNVLESAWKPTPWKPTHNTYSHPSPRRSPQIYHSPRRSPQTYHSPRSENKRPEHHKPDYSTVKDTSEVLRHTYNELAKEQSHLNRQDNVYSPYQD